VTEAQSYVTPWVTGHRIDCSIQSLSRYAKARCSCYELNSTCQTCGRRLNPADATEGNPTCEGHAREA